MDGYVLYPSLKGEKIRDQGNVNAPSPHLSQNETSLWPPFSSTRGVFRKEDSEKNTFAFTNCMKSCTGFGDKCSGLEETNSVSEAFGGCH